MADDKDDLSIPANLHRNPDEEVTAANNTNDTAALPVVADTPSGTSLLILDSARRELADAKTVDEVKSIRDKAIGLVAYAKQASDRHLEAEAVAIQMEADRRLGEMMQQQRETVGLNKGGRPKTGVCETPVSDQLPTLSGVGIDKNLAKKARAAASLTEEEFQARKKAMRERLHIRTGSRNKKSAFAVARAPTRRRKCTGRKRRTYLENCLFEISTVCKYDEKMQLSSELGAEKIDAAIAMVTKAIGELKKLIGRLEEAREGGAAMN